MCRTPGLVLFGLWGCSVLLAAGCADFRSTPRARRPVAGDRVTPEILLGKSWRQQGPVLLSARLQVQGKDDPAPELLQLEEVPYEIVPHVRLTFFAGDQALAPVEADLVRDC